jgi:general secretion pathway protein G
MMTNVSKRRGQRAEGRNLCALRSALCARSAAGFSIAELITVVAIIGILAAVALPVARFGIRRQKEIELRDRLRKITDAIDRYHDLMTMNPNSPVRPVEMQALKSDGYPKDFDELLKGIEMSDGKTVRLVRERDLVDPMTGRPEWIVKSTTDDPDSGFTNTCKVGESCTADNLFEIHSTSTALALDGKTHYNEW